MRPAYLLEPRHAADSAAPYLGRAENHMADKNFDDDLEFDEPLDLNPWQLHDPKC